MTPPKPEKPDFSPSGSTIDPLLECLVRLTAHFGHARSTESIRAGLAYDAEGMGPALFREAADRIGLKSGIVARPDFTTLPAAILPAVLILKNNLACVLFSCSNGKATIFSPESGAERDVAIADLKKDYTGRVIFIHPRAAFDDPSAPHADDMDRHWFFGAVHENRGVYGRAIGTAILINLFALATPIFTMNVYDRVIPNSAIETGWVLGLGALAVLAFDFIMRTLRGYFIDFAGRKIDVEAARRVFNQVLDMKLAHRPASSGAFANMLRDFDSIRDFLTSATLTGLVDLPFSLLFLAVIWMIGGWVALLLIFLVGLVVAFGFALQAPLRQLVRKSVHCSEVRHGLLVETISGLETIKAIGADGRFRARYGRHSGESALWGQKSRFVSALGVNVAAFLQQASAIFIVLGGMYMVRDQAMTMGGLIACVMLGSRALAPIGQIANLMTRYHQATGAYRTLEGIMSRPVERPAHAKFLHRPDLKGKITFDKVSFSYPGTKSKVLDGVSFTINPGEKVGIIGRIGSGKSTIARLILGLYDPDEGAILADDTDYRQIDPADLRRNTGYIAQDVVLFSGSVRDNITASRPQATEEEILAAAQAAGVHDFISRHPMGYDAPVGEGGAGLSGGQRQAIALARAILLKPNILVCDEPTNAMDVQAEDAFRRHVAGEIRARTLVLITHRQPLLSLVDRLILIDQGKVIADGPRDAVLTALAGGKIEVRI